MFVGKCACFSGPIVSPGLCGLNGNGSHRPIGSGAVGKCGLVGACLARLEENCHFGWGFEVSDS